MENAGLAVSQRSVQWSMDRLYPGLQMRIGPGINGGLLEFIVDPSLVYDERSHLLHEESTGTDACLRNFRCCMSREKESKQPRAFAAREQ
jgi:hypothetical protein